MTIRACMKCQRMLGEISPLGNGEVTHGLCSKCEVRILVEDDLATQDERETHAQDLGKMRTIQVTVPEYVVEQIDAQHQKHQSKIRRTVLWADFAGQILERESNRAEWTAQLLKAGQGGA
jgi:hypothetical protein